MRRVGELLKGERENKNYSFETIEKATKIKKEYLLAIEDGKFGKLPSEAYALGFVKNYADFLDLPKNKIAALFKREYEEEKREILPSYKKNTFKFTKGVVFGSKNILGALLFLIVVGYVIYQYSSLIFGPPLSVYSPYNGEAIQNNIVQVAGKTDPYSTITVNSEEVLVSENGTFKKSIYIFSGDRKVEVVAKNRFGKEKKIVIAISVK